MSKYKASEIAKWFLVHNRIAQYDTDSISNLKLQKLLYYAQGTYLAITGESLFDDKIYAWQHGPVVPEIYHEYKESGSNGIDASDIEDPKIDLDTVGILESVYETFGQYSAWKLRNMTHEESPWCETSLNNVISNEKIKKYFEDNYVE